jgi:heavy metal sensor kinase
VIRERTDQDLVSQVGSLRSLLSLQGIEAVKRVAVLEAQAAGEKKIFLRLLSSRGETFSSSNMSYWKDILIHKAAIKRLLAGEKYVFETVSIPNHRHNVRVIYGLISPAIVVQLGQALEHTTRFAEAFWKIFAGAMFLLIVVSALIGWFMARRAISGIAVITRTAHQIADGDLDQRVPFKPGGDEIDQLASTFNQMLDRIEMLVTRIREMSEDIAHDLRSPITRIRGLAEVTLTTGASRNEFEQAAASTVEECDRLLDMINTMLAISRTEAGVDSIDMAPLDLAEVVADACDLFAPIAEDKDIRLACRTPAACPVTGDVRMVQRLVANLIDNAIKYTPPGGAVRVATDGPAGDDHHVTLTISDTGVGIDSKDLPRVFERFYRCDPSRTAANAGIGLGLSLALAIARAHGGDILAESTPGSGSTFTLVLPSPRVS